MYAKTPLASAIRSTPTLGEGLLTQQSAVQWKTTWPSLLTTEKDMNYYVKIDQIQIIVYTWKATKIVAHSQKSE